MMNLLPYIYIGMAIFTFSYFAILWSYCGHVPAFGRFWAGAGVFSGTMALIGFLFTCDELVKGLFSSSVFDFIGENPDDFLSVLVMYCRNIYEGLSVFLFLYIAGMILGALYLSIQGNKKGTPGADYVIVLGSKVNGTRPSKALMSRIKKAYEYLAENPETKAVLTGGRGRDEEISEALCMKRELIGLGIKEERLLLEDRSTSTVENLVFAAEIIDVSKHILIITNDFHTLRGKSVAKVAGFQNVDSLGASSSKVMRLNYYTRETFSWVKFGLHGIRRRLFPESGI